MRYLVPGARGECTDVGDEQGDDLVMAKKAKMCKMVPILGGCELVLHDKTRVDHVVLTHGCHNPSLLHHRRGLPLEGTVRHGAVCTIQMAGFVWCFC